MSIDSPVCFMKPADAVVSDDADVPYNSLHHEVELVVALRSLGRDLDPAEASAAIFGYAVGLDLTRRDLQAKAKADLGIRPTASTPQRRSERSRPSYSADIPPRVRCAWM